MGRPKKVKKEETAPEAAPPVVETPPSEAQTPTVAAKTEKEILLELYQTLKDRGINSIGDLENKIARAE